MHSIIILDEQDSRFKFYPAYENINSQIIIKSDKYTYNFNADVTNSSIGTCSRSDILLQLLGCREGVKYKRECILDPPQLIIYQEDESEPAPPAPQSRTSYTNNINEISLTVEN